MNIENRIGDALSDRQKQDKELIIDELWEKSKNNVIIQRLKQGKSLQEIMNESSDLKKAFEKLRICGCSDGRVVAKEIGTAGNLILASKEEVDAFIKKHTGEIDFVESHWGCGAAKKKHNELKDKNKWEQFKAEYGLEGERVEDVFKDGDALGKWWAEWLAGKLGAVYRHIGKEKMRREEHDERVICFDGTGMFNPDALEEMPAHYTLTCVELSDKEYINELKVLCGIAFDDHHGFGHRFDGNNKFYILVCAQNQEQLDHLIEVAKEAMKNEEFCNKVEIKGFIHKVDEPDQ